MPTSKVFFSFMRNLRFALFVFFALLSFKSFSQTPEVKLPAKLVIGFTFSPDYSFRSLRSDPDTEWIADSRNDQEIPRLGFTTGPRILVVIGNRANLETGLLFADKGEKTKTLIYTSPPGNTQAPATGRHIHHYYYLDVPVKMNYYLTSQKIRFFVSGGVSINSFIANNRTSIYTFSDGSKDDREVTSNFAFNRVDFAAIAGAGVDYDINQKVQIRVEPVYRRSVVSIINTPIKSNLYSLGTNIGVFYKF